jgi:hypothetical protein
MALTDKLSAIGVAIREKTGKNELLTLDAMPNEIASIETGGGGELPEEAFVISGNCQYRLSYDGWNWYINTFGDKIITQDITRATSMFAYSKNLLYIPFDINVSGCEISNIFSNCNYLKEAPHINLNTSSLNNTSKADISDMFSACNHLQDVENVFDASQLEFLSNLKITSAYSTHSLDAIFSYCSSLRRVPSWLSYIRLNPESTTYPASSYFIYYNLFNACWTLDEVVDLPIISLPNAKLTSNAFNNTFYCCERIKEFTFETQEDGTPYTATWSGQTIDLSQYVGYISSQSHITLYNSGITWNEYVKDDATYQALKDNPNWWTDIFSLSRYNHDSAVNTINSLPDCSATGTNTIKFKGAAGALTDGGAINTLTEEEIAVAAAKGWTVSLV